jgi:antitoxin (DNA-binding transcriptional repressor) of toxin-antitoxin stability system
MECDVHYAKTNLSKLIKLVEAGEDVYITRRGERVVQLSRTSKPKPRFGTLEGLVGPIPDSSLFAMSDDEADDFLEGKW